MISKKKGGILVIDLVQKMKFVHIADMHFDAPFSELSDIENLGKLRRMEQRRAFNKIIQYIKDNQVEYLFISGDLYEEQYIKEETIKYINDKFKEIENTKIFISPGNHDPHIAKSYYATYNWSKNVYIFKSKLEKINLSDIEIYGYGFGDYYCEDSGINQLEIIDKNKVNILITHGDINGNSSGEKQYNPLNEKNLREKGFDYVALGHIHKDNILKEKNNEKKIIYPGSTISMGFDETGKHGMVVGKINNKKIEIEFIPVDEFEFKELEIDCTELYTIEELIEKIDNIKLLEFEIYKIILIGKRNFEINEKEIYQYNINKNIIKIKNQTILNYNIEKISQENNLMGIFTKKIIEKIKNATDKEEKDILERALEIGINAIEKNKN